MLINCLVSTKDLDDIENHKYFYFLVKNRLFYANEKRILLKQQSKIIHKKKDLGKMRKDIEVQLRQT